MAIEIKVEKVLFKGEKHYKILDVKALSEKDLPNMYRRGLPRCYQSYVQLFGTNTRVKGIALIPDDRCTATKWLCVGEAYCEAEFLEWKKVLNECGDRLTKINKRLAEQWSGVETIKI